MSKFSLWTKTILVGVLCFGLLALAGCGGTDTNSEPGTETGEDTAQTTLEKVKAQGYVTVGFANEKPYAYQTPEGELTGEAVEVARVILKNLGIEEMRGELTEFGALIPGLQAKRFDMITAGMYITPDRAKEVAFANPEYTIGEGLGVKKGNPLDLHSYEDIAKHETAIVAIPSGVIEYDYLTACGVPEDRIITVPDITSALAAVQAGRADAFTATGPAVQATLETANDSSLERVMDFQQPVIDGKNVKGFGATAFRKDDNDFREAFNAELKNLEESGELLKIIEPFGFTEQELPGGITAEEAEEMV
ncbi:MAG: ectoine/hydroxyectoine ABC transporter substrate-binding protein EhuB [Desulfitobacteriaceae bacterium]|nr:ectoine/hydroxyectoine ABC transporter substrate-binding protein EhuB [Desulfitobacteriaceae bacterium]